MRLKRNSQPYSVSRAHLFTGLIVLILVISGFKSIQLMITVAAILGYCWIIKLLATRNFRSLSRFTVFLCLLWFVLCGVGFSDAGTNTLLIVICFYVALAWGLSWIIRLILVWRKKNDLNSLKRPLVYWLIIPSAIFLPLLLSNLGGFCWVRFKLSEQALVKYVGEVRAGKIDLSYEFEHPPRQIGLYRITVTQLLPDNTVRFITSTHNFLDKAGFAHSPKQSPLKQGEDFYQQIDQDWWYYYQSW